MKNNVKITIILGAITSFFSVYPMEIPDYYTFEQPNLKHVNPLSNMHTLGIFRIINGTTPIPKDDPLFTNKSVALSLTVARVLKESDKVKNENQAKESQSKNKPIMIRP